MPKLKLYTIALTVTFEETGSPGVTRVTPGACAARRLGHAIDQGMDAARRLYPSQEGWSDHKAITIVIPSHLIEEIYTQEVVNVSAQTDQDPG